jgi:hypothetical protein
LVGLSRGLVVAHKAGDVFGEVLELPVDEAAGAVGTPDCGRRAGQQHSKAGVEGRERTPPRLQVLQVVCAENREAYGVELFAQL